MLEYARKLPRPIAERLRSLRDSLGIALFRPKITTQHFGGIPLTLKIADPVADLWYGQGCDRELPELAFLKRRKLRSGARVFDIGAHQGVLALQLAKATETGRVVAIEPGRFNFGIAQENKGLNRAVNLKLLNVAISEHGQEMPFRQGLNGRAGTSNGTVPSCTIDFLTRFYGAPDVVFLDVEGYEQLALQGASATLYAGPDWHVEIHQGTGLEWFGGSAAEIVNTFRSAGYSLYVQPRMDYRGEYQPLTGIPREHFYLIATRE